MQQPDISPLGLAWTRFRQNTAALLALTYIAVMVLIAVLGANIRPDKTRDANDQQISLSRKPPGFQVEVLRIARNEQPANQWFFHGFFFGGFDLPWREQPIERYRIEADSIFYVPFAGVSHALMHREVGLHLADVCYPMQLGSSTKIQSGNTLQITRSDGTTISTSLAEMQEQAKSQVVPRRYWLGTDKFGRDMLSRLMAGIMVSLSVGLISVIISLFIGVGLGALAGYFKGWIDDLIMWLINVVWAVPTLLMVIAITFALGKGFVQVFIAVGLTMWVEVARVVRGQVLGLREKEFVEAGKALGYRSNRIIFRHVLPNVASPVIVISAANFASAILLEAGLSFLGIGAQIPMPSWGQMIKENYAYITTDMAYLALAPGLCIVLLVLAFMVVGNGLRDALDVKLESK